MSVQSGAWDSYRQTIQSVTRPGLQGVVFSAPSRPAGSPGPPLPLLLLLALAAPVDDFGAGPELPQPQRPQPQLQVLGDLPAFGPDLLQPLDGRRGQAEVADGGTRLHANVALTLGREVALRPDHHLVLARVQQAPVIPISS